jgi:hypothetical protein
LSHILKGLAIFFVVFALGLCFPNLAFAQETTIVSVSAPSQVDPGEQFTVSVIVEPGTAIAGVQCDLTFNPALVTVDSVEEGDLLSQGGANTYFNPGDGSANGMAGVIVTPGQTVSAPGTFAIITLTAGTEGGVCSLTLSNVVAGDINGQSVPVNVVNGQVTINRPPVLNSIGDKEVDEGQLLEFTISATDADGDSLTYSASNLPQGASFNPVTHTFSWTPRYDQAGAYANIHFEVSDGNLSDAESITITVIQLYEDWDVNGDEAVNVLDMILVGQHWGEAGLTGWIQEDVNEDGTVSVLDMILIGQHWTG